MKLGEKIKSFRQNAGMSQKKLAELVGVSSQAVIKWEANQTVPNTETLFKLAAIFGTTVDIFLDTNNYGNQYFPEQIRCLSKMEKEKKKTDKRSKTKTHISIAAGLFFFVMIGIISIITYVRSLPVDYDAGACSGGYATFIFDKYNEELVKKYYDEMEHNSNTSSFKAVRGTQEAEWEGQTLFLQFDIQYEHSIQGTVTERIGFIGQRTWFDTYDWGSAIVKSD